MEFHQPPEGKDSRLYPRAIIYDPGTGDEIWVSAVDLIAYLRHFAETIGAPPYASELEAIVAVGSQKVIGGLTDEMEISLFHAQLNDPLYHSSDSNDPRSDT